MAKRSCAGFLNSGTLPAGGAIALAAATRMSIVMSTLAIAFIYLILTCNLNL